MNLPVRKHLAAEVERAAKTPLRPFQADMKRRILAAWEANYRNVMAVLPTGGGKTVVLSDLIHGNRGPACAIAHRQELVGQMSMALARNGVRHRVIGPKNVVKDIVNQHMTELGASWYDPQASCAVAGVDTLIRRKHQLRDWLPSVTMFVIDEGHHVLRDNKWGEACEMFPNARGLMPTATPIRAEGKGLGRHADGLADILIEGPSGRDLIRMGYLTDYRIFAPPSDVDLSDVAVSKTTGDYNKQQVVKAVRRSRIVGDVVKHYLRIAPGKLGVTFVPDTETAQDVADEYNANGVPAEIVTAKTPGPERAAILRRFRRRELLQLVNVDLFGEGFDLPAIEVVSMARPTKSFALFCQQFGRALRIIIDPALAAQWDDLTDEQRRAAIAASEKTRALIIDHVDNVHFHAQVNGLPDSPREWSLDRREKKRRSDPSDAVPVRTCLNVECLAVYERFHKCCPFCGHYPQPQARSGPEYVDGDLTELDAETLAQLRGEAHVPSRQEQEQQIAQFRSQLQQQGLPATHVMRNVKLRAQQMDARREAVNRLFEASALWGGYHRAWGREDSEIYRRFYHRFGVDMLGALAQDAEPAQRLAEQVESDVARWGA